MNIVKVAEPCDLFCYEGCTACLCESIFFTKLSHQKSENLKNLIKVHLIICCLHVSERQTHSMTFSALSVSYIIFVIFSVGLIALTDTYVLFTFPSWK